MKSIILLFFAKWKVPCLLKNRVTYLQILNFITISKYLTFGLISNKNLRETLINSWKVLLVYLKNKRTSYWENPKGKVQEIFQKYLRLTRKITFSAVHIIKFVNETAAKTFFNFCLSNSFRSCHFDIFLH